MFCGGFKPAVSMPSVKERQPPAPNQMKSVNMTWNTSISEKPRAGFLDRMHVWTRIQPDEEHEHDIKHVDI